MMSYSSITSSSLDFSPNCHLSKKPSSLTAGSLTRASFNASWNFLSCYSKHSFSSLMRRYSLIEYPVKYSIKSWIIPGKIGSKSSYLKSFKVNFTIFFFCKAVLIFLPKNLSYGWSLFSTSLPWLEPPDLYELRDLRLVIDFLDFSDLIDFAPVIYRLSLDLQATLFVFSPGIVSSSSLKPESVEISSLTPAWILLKSSSVFTSRRPPNYFSFSSISLSLKVISALLSPYFFLLSLSSCSIFWMSLL